MLCKYTLKKITGSIKKLSLQREHNRALSDFAKAHGWRIDKTNGNHLRLTHPAVDHFIIAPSTPGCFSSTTKTLARMMREMRAAGLVEKSKNQQPCEVARKTYGNVYPELKTTAADRRGRSSVRRAGLVGSGSFAAFEQSCGTVDPQPYL